MPACKCLSSALPYGILSRSLPWNSFFSTNAGQLTFDPDDDSRTGRFAPAVLAGKKSAERKCVLEQMKKSARAAALCARNGLVPKALPYDLLKKHLNNLKP